MRRRVAALLLVLGASFGLVAFVARDHQAPPSALPQAGDQLRHRLGARRSADDPDSGLHRPRDAAQQIRRAGRVADVAGPGRGEAALDVLGQR